MKLIDEVLHAQFLKQFQNWTLKQGKMIPEWFVDVQQKLQTKYQDSPNDAVVIGKIMKVVVDESLEPMIANFKEHGLELSATFRFWDDYLQKVSISLKVFISATRNGGWAVYQSAKAKLLPLLFASIRNTYAKYMPVLLLLMKRLPPEVISDFVQRQFVAKLTPGKFNCTWMDYALESTENRALKGIGGIIGLTLRGPALARWFLSRPVTAKYSAVFADMCHNKASKSKDINHHSASKTEIKRWNADINKMNGMFNKSYINPFNVETVPQELVNFATRVVAKADVQESLVNALETGADLANKFVNERLAGDEEHGPSKSFYDKVPRANIKTMADMNKGVKIKSKDVFVSGEAMYIRLLTINSKKVPLGRVMSFENSAKPIQ